MAKSLGVKTEWERERERICKLYMWMCYINHFFNGRIICLTTRLGVRRAMCMVEFGRLMGQECTFDNACGVIGITVEAFANVYVDFQIGKASKRDRKAHK